MQQTRIIKVHERLRLELLAAKNYQEFLQIYCDKKRGGISYATLTKRAGFSSRAYVRETVLGRRRLTLPASLKFSLGMKLSADWKEYFHCLAALDCKDFLPDQTPAEIQEKLKMLTGRLKQIRKPRTQKSERPDLADQVLRIQDFPLIYAAIGIDDEQVTVADVVNRTGVDRKIVESSLQKMKKLGLILFEGQHITPLDNHFVLSEAGRSRFARELFLSAIRALSHQCNEDFSSKEKLFHQSFLCVQKKDLPALKKQLDETILHFVNQALNNDGDKIVRILVALT